MLVFDHMHNLEDFFAEENKRGRRMQDLYEVIQVDELLSYYFC